MSQVTYTTQASYDAGHVVFPVAVVDVSRDGVLDLATATVGSGSVSVLLGSPPAGSR